MTIHSPLHLIDRQLVRYLSLCMLCQIRIIILLKEMPTLKRELMKAISVNSTLKSIVFQSYGYPFDNTEIRNLLDENQLLREQIEELKESKIELVRSTSKVIDDFRRMFQQ